MKFSVFALIVSMQIFHSDLIAQQIESGMQLLSERFEPEKLHIHFDRSVYRNGETVFYKAYLFTRTEVSGISKTIYVDWYDENGILLLQSQAPVLLSGAKGSFSIPEKYNGKSLQVKAYTRWMLNFDTAFLYCQSIKVYQPDINPSYVTKQKTIVQIQLYPEGGFSIAGINNRFAFKAIDQWQKPVRIEAVIKNKKGILVDSVKSVHDGMGMFYLNLQNDEGFTFHWADENGNGGKIDLTAQKKSGAILRVVPAGKKAFFTIERSVDAGNEFKTMHLLVHRNLTLRYKLDINMAAKTSISSEIMLNDLSTGIVQFTLFNANWIPVAERIIFVNNHSHSFYPQIFLIKKDLSKRGLNKIIISVPDTLLTITSVAVTEAVLADRDGPTIFSDFLLSDEIRGKVNNANYYFSSDIQFDSLTRIDKLTDSALAAHLDLVMLTHGHRRYNWEQIANGVMPPIQYTADTSYIQIKGQVTAGRLHHFKEPLSLNMVLFTKDSAKNIFTVPVQSDGSFEKSHLFYYDTAKLYYSLIAAKKIKGVVNFNNSFLSGEERKNFFKNLSNEVQKNNFPMTDKNSLSVTSEIFYRELNKRLDFKAGTTLKEVKVKVRLKTAKQVLDEYYTSGFYSGEGNNYMIDVEGDITSSRYRDIFAYLQTKIPGLNVVYNYNAGPIPLWYPNSQGIPDVPAFLLDEVPVSLESVSSIDVNSIAYVKAFRPPFLGSLLNGFSGVIVLYSKRGYSPLYNNENSIAGLETHLLPGYTLFKEFTQPVYPDLATTTEEDYRPTLYWNPFIIIDKNNPQFEISFYNNDISKKLCVVLEGINIEGKMTRIVKMLE